jgi:hypothetical protein
MKEASERGAGPRRWRQQRHRRAAATATAALARTTAKDKSRKLASPFDQLAKMIQARDCKYSASGIRGKRGDGINNS